MPDFASMARPIALVCALAALGFATPSRAQSAPAQPIVKIGPCDGPEFRQFDFWIGRWDVFTPDGQRAGTSTIERILGGCAISENWSGSKGTDGRSFNIYSTADARWHQTWVDSEGTLLELAGAFQNGRMVLEGESPAASGNTVRNRITWEKLPDGSVRQHWQVSPPGEEKWTDAFVGIYTRQTKPAAAKGSKR